MSEVRYQSGYAKRAFAPFAKYTSYYEPARYDRWGAAGHYTTPRGLARIVARETDPIQWSEDGDCRVLQVTRESNYATVYYRMRGDSSVARFYRVLWEA